ncbi:MAG: response regulator [Candidatus Omnitrophota bacterium]
MITKKILLVEDEKDLAETVTFRLESAGYMVIVARDGKEALEKVRNDKPDLIVLDIMLPKIDGYKVCAILKRDMRYMKIPIMMFTARAQEEDEKLGRELGADAYMTKPFEPVALLAMVKTLLEG